MKPWRMYVVGFLFLCGSGAIASRVAYLAVTDRDFLQREGDARSLRTLTIPAYRGVIYDRQGQPLALSTPVASVWTNPRTNNWDEPMLAAIAAPLQTTPAALRELLTASRNKEFKYLKRRASWDTVQALKALDIDNLNFDPEYKRYYPASEIASHVVGMTGIDDLGLEGIELAFDSRLRGQAGRKQVLKDRRGRTMENLAYLQEAKGGQDINLSLDLRLQYFAYRELKAAVEGHQATSASVVMVDVKSGEILALVNEPSYNPNESQGESYYGKRNLAVTDVYEPGSTVKPFAILAALESGEFNADSQIDTAPGYLRVGSKLIEDPVNRGTLSLSQVLQRSSQVGVAKVALALPERSVYDVMARVGLGEYIGTGLPGEAVGQLSDADLRSPIVRSTLAYGYGLAVSPLQLASAYLTLASGGQRMPLSILKREQPTSHHREFDPRLTTTVLEMLETVTAAEGTAPKARLANYRVAGKTGTARKLGDQGYDDERHVALFAGVAPVSDPRIVVVVVVDEPQAEATGGTRGEGTGGGAIAAPIFARIAARSLRLLGVAPDIRAPVVAKPVAS